jgi:hypothetical protein
LMDYDLNVPTVLPQTKTVDAVASAHDKHAGISPGVLLAPRTQNSRTSPATRPPWYPCLLGWQKGEI